MAADGKTVVLVTGANAGIGWETAKSLFQSAKPYHVLLGTRSLDKGEAAVAKLKEHVPETSSTVELVQIDVANDESITAAFEKVEAAHGRIDVLVNNSGAILATLWLVSFCFSFFLFFFFFF
jgi:NAD(P)-dependent dehydrogenase (short-subunit alcohol dehydrogenase family)